MWPVHTIKIPGYENWEVEIWDLSVSEVAELNAAIQDGPPGSVVRVLVPSIKSWNVVDRQGAAMPISEEGLNQMPMPAARGLLAAILQKMNEDPFPKATSTSEC